MKRKIPALLLPASHLSVVAEPEASIPPASRTTGPIQGVGTGTSGSLGGTAITSIRGVVRKAVMGFLGKVSSPYLSPRRVASIMTGPFAFQALRTAFTLGIFDVLEGPVEKTAAEIQHQLALDAEVLKRVLEWCCALQVCKLKGGRYRSTLTAHDLDRLRATMDWVHVVNYRQLFHLDKALLEKQPAGLRSVYGNQYTDIYTAMEYEGELHNAWSKAMNNLHHANMERLFSLLDYTRFQRVLDAGGHDGTGAIELARRFPHLEVDCFDLPFKRDLVESRFRDASVEARCSFVGGDFFDSLPTGYDLIQFNNVYEMFSSDNLRHLFRNAFAALAPGGMTMSYGSHLPESVTSFPEPYLLNAYFNTSSSGEGGLRRVGELMELIASAGFRSVESLPREGIVHPAESASILVLGVKGHAA